MIAIRSLSVDAPSPNFFFQCVYPYLTFGSFVGNFLSLFSFFWFVFFNQKIEIELCVVVHVFRLFDCCVERDGDVVLNRSTSETHT